MTYDRRPTNGDGGLEIRLHVHIKINLIVFCKNGI